MGLPPVGNGPFIPTTQNKAAPAGPVKLGVDGASTAENIGKAFTDKFKLSEGEGAAFAKVLGSIQSKSSRSAVLNKVETKMNEFIKNNPNASDADIAKEAKKQLTAQTFMYKHLEDSISKMAQDSISRMRDTFSDS